MLKVCYLNDVFASVNELNTSMQGRDQNIITLSEKLSAFKEKLLLWKGKLERGRTAAFPSLNEYLEEWEDDKIGALEAIKPILVNHLDHVIEYASEDGTRHAHTYIFLQFTQLFHR